MNFAGVLEQKGIASMLPSIVVFVRPTLIKIESLPGQS
jgi:hypothetical protein